MLIRTFATLLVVFALCAPAVPFTGDAATWISADNPESSSAADDSALPVQRNVGHARRVRAVPAPQRLSDAGRLVAVHSRLPDTPVERACCNRRPTVLRI